MTTLTTEEQTTQAATGTVQEPKATTKANVAPRKPRVAPSKGKSGKKATCGYRKLHRVTYQLLSDPGNIVKRRFGRRRMVCREPVRSQCVRIIWPYELFLRIVPSAHCNGLCNGSGVNWGNSRLIARTPKPCLTSLGAHGVRSCLHCGSSGRGFESLHPPQNQEVIVGDTRVQFSIVMVRVG
jgi:hypothetical protein